MAKYFSPELVCRSFERLSSRNRTGKAHMERTSALMYFLSADAALKHFAVNRLNLNPDSLDGKNNRKQVELEFTRLVLLANTQGNIKQVTELGRIDRTANSPEKRVSSNFLTVPLKKASNQVSPYYYPNRPKCPLFKMGLAATGEQWGLSLHENWGNNFLEILTSAKSSTPMLDLAVFVCRDCLIDDSIEDISIALQEQLHKRYTSDVVDFWIERIDKEGIFAPHIEASFADHYEMFANYYKQASAPKKLYTQMSKSELIDRIHQLESELETNNQP